MKRGSAVEMVLFLAAGGAGAVASVSAVSLAVGVMNNDHAMDAGVMAVVATVLFSTAVAGAVIAAMSACLVLANILEARHGRQ